MLRFYWILFVVVLLFLVIGVPIVFLGHVLKKLFGVEDFVHPFARFGCKVWIWSFGARVHVTGREHLVPGQAYVFASNHQSNVDPPFLFAYLGPITGAIAKKELTKFPIMKQGFPLAHVVPIDRRNRESAIESTRRGAAELRKGYSLMAFPEGTRTVDGRVKEFKKGVFLWRSKPEFRWCRWSSTIRGWFGEKAATSSRRATFTWKFCRRSAPMVTMKTTLKN